MQCAHLMIDRGSPCHNVTPFGLLEVDDLLHKLQEEPVSRVNCPRILLHTVPFENCCENRTVMGQFLLLSDIQIVILRLVAVCLIIRARVALLTLPLALIQFLRPLGCAFLA